MPIYCWKCSDQDACAATTEIYQKSSQPPESVECPECGQPMKRNYSAEHGASLTDWRHPLESTGAAVQADQVPEARRIAAQEGIPIRYKDDGTALFESKRKRSRALKKLGMIDKDGFD